MNLNSQMTIQAVLEYRNKLITYGKLVSYENPDNLAPEELQALVSMIFEELKQLDSALHHAPYDHGIKTPETVGKLRQHELYMDFLDWYQVISTPSNVILEYVKKQFPQSKFPKVLCVGDGEHCHLGRKLALAGYDVIVVDPVSKKEFSSTRNGCIGMVNVINSEFNSSSKGMTDWADVVVGAKVPQCAESLIKIDKPTVFNISTNAQVHNMSFEGKKITSSKQLEKEIEKYSRVKKVKHVDNFGFSSYLYTCDGRELEER